MRKTRRRPLLGTLGGGSGRRSSPRAHQILGDTDSRGRYIALQRERQKKLSPDRELSYVYLGCIFKATGDLRMARKTVNRALELRPDCHPALQELRLLEICANERERTKRSFGRRRGG